MYLGKEIDMENKTDQEVDSQKIRELMDKDKYRIKMMLKVCAHCSMCAHSCFLYTHSDDDPKYIPSHKMINSLGYLYKRKGKVSLQDLEKIKEIVWERCVLCTRCYCPLGVDIPAMISLTRQICRSQGVYREYGEEG